MLPIWMKSTSKEPTIHIQRTKTCSRTRIPHLQRLVTRCRHDAVSCCADRTPTHHTPMPTQLASLLTRARIPHLERLVSRSRHDGVSRRADRTPTHPIRMPAQRVSLLPCMCIPHLECVVI